MSKRTCLGLALLALAFTQCTENPLEPESRKANEIWFQGGQVQPKTLTVTAGTTVIWTNKDDVSHSVDSGTFMNPTSEFPQSPNLGKNQSYSHAFGQAGTFNYYCVRHQTRQSEHGTIVVQ